MISTSSRVPIPPGPDARELAPLPGEALPPLAGARGRRLRVVVLTCGEFGWETAHRIRASGVADVVALFRAPLQPGRSMRQRLRSVYRLHGIAGLVRIPVNRWRALMERRRSRRLRGDVPSGTAVPLVHCQRFEDDASLTALRALDCDLAIVDGTYILKPGTFLAPRFGAINLHCGKLPDFRGAPPAFWELFHGVPEVGVTVHRVTERVDEGPILQQAVVPLDLAPDEDPVAYVHRLWREVLRPRGIELVVEALRAISEGTVVERPQGPSAHPTFRRPDHRLKDELRARVAARRGERAAH